MDWLQQERRGLTRKHRRRDVYACRSVCCCEGVYLCGWGVTSCHTTGKSARLSHICQHARGAMPEICRVRGHDATLQSAQITYPAQSITRLLSMLQYRCFVLQYYQHHSCIMCVSPKEPVEFAKPNINSL